LQITQAIRRNFTGCLIIILAVTIPFVLLNNMQMMNNQELGPCSICKSRVLQSYTRQFNYRFNVDPHTITNARLRKFIDDGREDEEFVIGRRSRRRAYVF
jgi:hypothetical protein